MMLCRSALRIKFLALVGGLWHICTRSSKINQDLSCFANPRKALRISVHACHVEIYDKGQDFITNLHPMAKRFDCLVGSFHHQYYRKPHQAYFLSCHRCHGETSQKPSAPSCIGLRWCVPHPTSAIFAPTANSISSNQLLVAKEWRACHFLQQSKCIQ